MLKRLRRKFVLTAALSLAAVLFVLILGLNGGYYFISTAATDQLLVSIAENDGGLPPYSENAAPQMPWDYPITQETRYETRYFLMRADETGAMTELQLEFIRAVSEEDAVSYFEETMNRSSAFGYIGHYRFYRCHQEDGYLLIFLDCSRQLRSVQNVLWISCVGAVVILSATILLLFFLSNRAIRPTVRTMEEQKRFITDASHEIRTPLTAILASCDLMLMDEPDNEWLCAVKQEAEQMSNLVSELVTLSRLDEGIPAPERTRFLLSRSAWDIVQSIQPLAVSRGKQLQCRIEKNLWLYGSEAAVQRLISILLENALKYADEGSTICLRLYRRRRVIYLETANPCRPIAPETLERLFDRFYRADPSRSRCTGGSGIGLSIAKAIVEAHGGQIRAQYDLQGDHSIHFTASLRDSRCAAGFS